MRERAVRERAVRAVRAVADTRLKNLLGCLKDTSENHKLTRSRRDKDPTSIS